ncbi:MAG: c(7)-type cytochrome triheme domain-containing protein [Thermodesulfobacteriota bacterium]
MRYNSFLFAILLFTATAAGLFIPGHHAAAEEIDINARSQYRKIKPPGAWGTLTMERNTKGSGEVKPVEFPHWAHRTKYTCKVCHTDLGFSINSGGTDIKQADIEAGKYCGACHDSKTAFGPLECVRCHSKGLDITENTAPEKTLGGLPKDQFGNQVDWVAAVKNGSIKPAASLDGKEKMTVLDMDVTIPVTKYPTHPPDVIFPHKAHTEQLDCATCHPAIFNQKKGGNPDMNMMKIIAGQYCGECHTTVAFPIEDCFRCHSGPIPVAKELKGVSEDVLKELREKDRGNSVAP